MTLRWDANNPAPEGYRVFARQSGQRYHYTRPIWESNQTTCTLIGLNQGVTYHFVVRAFDGNLESADSQEVSCVANAPISNQKPSVDPGQNQTVYEKVMVILDGSGSIRTDVDGDNVPDVFDRFPNDPGEWADNDHDGIGDNQDTDDDNDGMTDSWELSNGLDPLSNDAGQDADGDGVTNLAEFMAETNPTAAPGNTGPDAPVVDTDLKAEQTGLAPVLVAGDYFDTDNDSHYQTRWQISTESNFATLILDETCQTQLTTYTVGPMVLDTDTVYYWRVKYIDERRGASQWSQTATFTTVSAHHSDDTDSNGIPDAQEVGPSADVDEDGTPDCQEANMMSVNTVEGQAMVGVEPVHDDVRLVSVKSLPTDSIPDALVKMEFGLIGFKLYLKRGVTRASVTIHFSTQVSRDARLYKYHPDSGWQVYDNAVFAANRKSVTLMLVDGGMGDEDGVENGVIVDPSGIAYTADSAALSTGQTTTGGGGDGLCFISAAEMNRVQPSTSNGSRPWVLMADACDHLRDWRRCPSIQENRLSLQLCLHVLLTLMNGSRSAPSQKVGVLLMKSLS